MVCPRCGAPTSPNARFCPNCGATLVPVQQRPMMPAMYPPPTPARKGSNKLLIMAVIVLVLVVIIAAAVAAGASKAKNNGSNNNANTTDNTNNSDNSIVNTNGTNNNNNANTNTRDQIANITYTGSGDKVSAKFTLQAGVTIFHMTHSGTSNFAVTLMEADGGYVDLLANEIGTFSGETLIGVEAGSVVGAVPGEHFLDIEANGAWTIVIEQPRVSSGAALPQTLTGHGASASIPIDLTSGVVLFNMTHSGSSNFAVVIWADDGDYVDLLANEIGDYSGETSLTVDGRVLNASPGIHWLDVDADGTWTIKITKM